MNLHDRTQNLILLKGAVQQGEDMSVSLHVVGFKPPDDKWKKMKAVWDSCKEAGVDPPAAVDKFFGGEPPDPTGVEISEHTLKKEVGAVTEWHEDMRDGFQVELSKLPKDIKFLRFYVSY